MEEGTETKRYFGCFDILPGHTCVKRASASSCKVSEAARACKDLYDALQLHEMHLLSELTRQARQRHGSFNGKSKLKSRTNMLSLSYFVYSAQSSCLEWHNYDMVGVSDM